MTYISVAPEQSVEQLVRILLGHRPVGDDGMHEGGLDILCVAVRAYRLDSLECLDAGVPEGVELARLLGEAEPGLKLRPEIAVFLFFLCLGEAEHRKKHHFAS